jgi:ParB family chromosome partitioning protein
MPQRSGLGKGLDALIPSDLPSTERGGVTQIPLEAVARNPRQPRLHLDSGELEELAASIREHGIIQPLIVSPAKGGDGYVLIAGERRLEAARQAGLRSVPAILREVSDQQRLELALIENVQRADLNPLEEAEAYRQLSEDFKLSHDEIAARVGKSRVTVTNTLRLLNLAPLAKQALVDDEISEGHARALLALSKAGAQEAALQTILSRGLNVRQTEELVRKISGHKPGAKPKPAASPEATQIEERLRASLGTKVSLRYGAKGGSLTIYYYSDEELDTLLQRLLNESP